MLKRTIQQTQHPTIVTQDVPTLHPSDGATSSMDLNRRFPLNPGPSKRPKKSARSIPDPDGVECMLDHHANLENPYDTADYEPPLLPSNKKTPRPPLSKLKKEKVQKARKAWVHRIPRDLRTGANAWRADLDPKGKHKEMQYPISPNITPESAAAAYVQYGIQGPLNAVEESPLSTHAHRFPFVALTLTIDPIGLPPSLTSHLYRMGFRYQHQTLFRKRTHKLSFLLYRPEVGNIVHREYLTEVEMLRRKAERYEGIMLNAKRRKDKELEAQREAIEEDAKMVDGFG